MCWAVGKFSAGKRAGAAARHLPQWRARCSFDALAAAAFVV
jgi:hypothetical protein